MHNQTVELYPASINEKIFTNIFYLGARVFLPQEQTRVKGQGSGIGVVKPVIVNRGMLHGQ
jgi:hypothetical protein